MGQAMNSLDSPLTTRATFQPSDSYAFHAVVVPPPSLLSLNQGKWNTFGKKGFKQQPQEQPAQSPFDTLTQLPDVNNAVKPVPHLLKIKRAEATDVRGSNVFQRNKKVVPLLPYWVNSSFSLIGPLFIFDGRPRLRTWCRPGGRSQQRPRPRTSNVF
jgi:hypothetical protein